MRVYYAGGEGFEVVDHRADGEFPFRDEPALLWPAAHAGLAGAFVCDDVVAAFQRHEAADVQHFLLRAVVAVAEDEGGPWGWIAAVIVVGGGGVEDGGDVESATVGVVVLGMQEHATARHRQQSDSAVESVGLGGPTNCQYG